MGPKSLGRAVHLTSAHPRFDVRIFLKQCISLANNGWSTALVVADGRGDETVSGVDIVDVGRPSGRLARMAVTPRRVYEVALKLDADIYHLHDPELLPVGVSLKRRGKRVVFDSHEDVPKDIIGKSYLVPAARVVTSRVFAAFERWACSRFDAIVAATPSIREHFELFHPVVVDINNYPLPHEIATGAGGGVKRLEVCYVGGISRARGVRHLVDAMESVRSGVRLQLIGEFILAKDHDDVRARPGWRSVDAHGQLDRAQVTRCLEGAIAGVVTYLPEPNHVAAQPNKLFEYMGAGLPVIVSDFPLWRTIVEARECGLCVDPEDPGAIAAAIDTLAGDPAAAVTMGANGRRAVLTHFNWVAEEKKLLELYESLARPLRGR